MLYLQAREEANALFDFQMEQVASALPSRFPAGAAGASAPDGAAPNVVIQIWDPTGVRIYFSHDYADLPQRAVLGFSTIDARGQAWGVYSAQQGPTGQYLEDVPLAAPQGKGLKKALMPSALCKQCLEARGPAFLLLHQAFTRCRTWLAGQRIREQFILGLLVSSHEYTFTDDVIFRPVIHEDGRTGGDV